MNISKFHCHKTLSGYLYLQSLFVFMILFHKFLVQLDFIEHIHLLNVVKEDYKTFLFVTCVFKWWPCNSDSWAFPNVLEIKRHFSNSVFVLKYA